MKEIGNITKIFEIVGFIEILIIVVTAIVMLIDHCLKILGINLNEYATLVICVAIFLYLLIYLK